MALDLLKVYDSFRGGQQAARQNRLADIAEQGRERELRKAETQEFLSAAYGADSPEKWGQVVQRFKDRGHVFAPGEDAWDNRDSLMRGAMSVADQMGWDWRKEEAQREQSNADRTFTADQSYKTRSLAQDQRQHEDTLALQRDKIAAENGKSMRPDLKDITTIRKEIGDLPSYKTYSAALPVYNSMTKAADTKAGDLNLVYGLAKIFDPTSVVREGEQVLVRDTASLPDWLVGQINSLNGGNRLLADTRNSLMKEARNRVDAYKGAYESNLQPYRGIAGRYQINEDDIIPQMGAIEEAPSAGQADPLGLR
jgi:hypothetical protein